MGIITFPYALPAYFLLLVLVFFVPVVMYRLARLYIHWDRMGNRIRLIHSLRPNLERFPACVVGFMHPYCDGGGGGERVLWTAVRCLQDATPHVVCAIYTAEKHQDKQVRLDRVYERFGITIRPQTVEFIHVHRYAHLLQASTYPRFTLLGQSLGSMVFACEAFSKLVPDTFIDTTGYAFMFPVAKFLADATVLTYVHYPTISTDMLRVVADRSAAHNNDAWIANSPTTSMVKLVYYQVFAWMYGLVGSLADVIMVNSTWTKGHIDALWKYFGNRGEAKLIYPPCDLIDLHKFSLNNRERVIVSVAQFRPEKNHELQIKAFVRYIQSSGDHVVNMVLIGGVRNKEDEARVEALKALAKQLDVLDRIEFVVNADLATLHQHLRRASVGLHTMWNEHFGISVAEYMASGVIAIAHDSAGPKMDLVVPMNGEPSGYLAHDEATFADAIAKAFALSPSDALDMRQRARLIVNKFGELEFRVKFLNAITPYLFV
jgi:alpha-1,2-mannosyltransferase